MVDYSKWDNIDISDDDDDDDNDNDNQPKVTKYDKAGKFHIGPKGSTFFDNDDDYNNFKSTNDNNDNNDNKNNNNDNIKSKVEEIDTDILTTWSKNGSKLDQYIWCQNKNDVIIRVALDNTIKAGNIKVLLDDKKLSIIAKGDHDILTGTLSQHVIRNHEDEDAIDWEIISINPQCFALSGITNFTRVLEITLKKKSPFSDAIIWWSKVFENDPDIDISKISERKVNSSFQDNWNEAHKLFKEKIANNVKTTIDLDDDDA